MSLPLCPCGSGKFYEECCYKMKDANGEPLFFKGAMTGDINGNWHPIPNSRFLITLVGQTSDKYREYAAELVLKSKLVGDFHNDFINHYGIFYQAYEQLLNLLKTSDGKGVSFQTDSIDVRKQWRDFLLNGRILLDFIGRHCDKTLSLNQRIHKLNEKQFDSLLIILEKQGARDKKFLEIKLRLEPWKKSFVYFIKFRNEEKKYGNTIKEFPTLDSEYGLVKDGKISLMGNTLSFSMIEFIKSSYISIREITQILLGI